MEDQTVELLENQLYFAVLKGSTYKKLKNISNTFYFSIDDEFVYKNYFNDFGPLNISHLYKYCCKLKHYLEHFNGVKKIIHYTSSNMERKTNSAYLIGSFAVIYLNMTPKSVHEKLMALEPYKPFVDASLQPHNNITISLIDCLNAVRKAIIYNFVDFNDFDVTECDLYDELAFGNINWIVPRKFAAFLGPTQMKLVNRHKPQFYLKYFLQNDIKTVVRLNNKAYDASIFPKNGIEHHDLFFPDGTVPSNEILIKFLRIAETAPAAIAVHCKAGLGRTGTLIGAYIIKHYQLTAKETIAWIRICRPGSVIGQQQRWLEDLQSVLLQRDQIPQHRYGIYSREWPIVRARIITDARNKKRRQNQEDVALEERGDLSKKTLELHEYKKYLKIMPAIDQGNKIQRKDIITVDDINENKLL